MLGSTVIVENKDWIIVKTFLIDRKKNNGYFITVSVFFYVLDTQKLYILDINCCYEFKNVYNKNKSELIISSLIFMLFPTKNIL